MSVFCELEAWAHERRRYHDLTSEDRAPRYLVYPRYTPDRPPREPRKNYKNITLPDGEVAQICAHYDGHLTRVQYSLIYKGVEYTERDLDSCFLRAGLDPATIP